jgi:hypothetical protein
MKEKNENINQDIAANINQIIIKTTSAKITNIKETSQPNDCLI